MAIFNLLSILRNGVARIIGVVANETIRMMIPNLSFQFFFLPDGSILCLSEMLFNPNTQRINSYFSKDIDKRPQDFRTTLL